MIRMTQRELDRTPTWRIFAQNNDTIWMRQGAGGEKDACWIEQVEIIPDTVEPSVVHRCDVTRTWVDIYADHNIDPKHIEHDGGRIVTVWHGETEEGKANARLYKNAEKLLRAVKKLTDGDTSHQLAVLRKIIAEIEGKTSE